MKKTIKIIFPLVVIAATAFIINTIFNTPPKVKKELKKSARIEVELKQLKKEDFTAILESYGVAQAGTKSTLSSQVSGKIVYINENFKNGGYFKKGDILLRIEETDYKADVSIANADLILAKQTLLEEKAKAKQAKEEWESFNSHEKPQSLVLRTPHLESAKAGLIAAQAKLQKAELNLQRTKITASFDGRVIEKSVSIAQVISSNTPIGVVFASGSIELRLPIKNKEISLIDIQQSVGQKTPVKIRSRMTSDIYEGKIVRSESSIDENTKQLYLVCEIEDKDRKIKLGEYFTAEIKTKTIKDVIVIPNYAIYQSSYVYVEKNGSIQRRDVEILWQNDQNSIISKGLKEGENLVVTTLGLVSSGTKIKPINKTEDKQ